jgi:hypothetical protein
MCHLACCDDPLACRSTAHQLPHPPPCDRIRRRRRRREAPGEALPTDTRRRTTLRRVGVVSGCRRLGSVRPRRPVIPVAPATPPHAAPTVRPLASAAAPGMPRYRPRARGGVEPTSTARRAHGRAPWGRRSASVGSCGRHQPDVHGCLTFIVVEELLGSHQPPPHRCHHGVSNSRCKATRTAAACRGQRPPTAVTSSYARSLDGHVEVPGRARIDLGPSRRRWSCSTGYLPTWSSSPTSRS